MNEQAAIDETALAQLLETVGGDTEFLAELIDAYFADTPQLLANMRGALATGNSTDLHRAAHTLKGSGAYFGALRLAALCQELEQRAAAGRLDGAAGFVDDIEAEYERGKPALTAAREGGGGL